jgi:hypothetical protein
MADRPPQHAKDARPGSAGRSFAPAEKFASEVAGRKLRPAYVLIGDEVFFRDQCRQALLQHLVPPDMRDFSLHDLDLAQVSVAEVLDRARTPSLMAPFQVFFVRGVKELYGRGSHAEEFAAIATAAKIAITPANVMGSFASTPNSIFFRKPVSASELNTPRINPAAVSLLPCAITSRNTSPCCAPSAMRIPISRVRCVTR